MSNSISNEIRTARSYRILVVITLVILSVQEWFGDYVNIFVAPANGTQPFAFSFNGFINGVSSLGFPLEYHAYEGILLLGLAVAVFALSFKLSNSKGVRISAGLALLSMASAAIGGLLFVLSGFSDGGNSAQMGGSFLGAYALYFISLYYSK